MKKEEGAFLVMLFESLEDAVAKLEYYYNSGDERSFNITKKFILKIHEKIEEVTNESGREQ